MARFLKLRNQAVTIKILGLGWTNVIEIYRQQSARSQANKRVRGETCLVLAGEMSDLQS